MNELVFKDMETFMNRFMDAEQRRIKDNEEIKPTPPHFQELRSTWKAINKGCPCRRNARRNHALITYRNTFLSLPEKGRRDLLDFLQVGESISKLIIKSGDLVLCEIQNVAQGL